MKLYLSVDMEGVAGISHWDETYKNKPDYNELRQQMTAEAVAACEGAIEAGATEIWVQDAHDSGRNLVASRFPKIVKLVSGWSGHPFGMVQELDSSFQAVCFVGYHAPVGSGASPLAHTMTTNYSRFSLNGQPASEFLLHALAASSVGVPAVFVSGDEGLCEHARAVNPAVTAVAVKKGAGSSVVSLHPAAAAEAIRSGVRESLRGDLKRCLLKLPGKFSLTLGFKEHARALKASFYPGVTLVDAHTLSFETDSCFEMMRFTLFVL